MPHGVWNLCRAIGKSGICMKKTHSVARAWCPRLAGWIWLARKFEDDEAHYKHSIMNQSGGSLNVIKGWEITEKNVISLRIRECPKKGIGPPTFLFFSDGIGTLNPIRSGGVWILRDCSNVIFRTSKDIQFCQGQIQGECIFVGPHRYNV